MSVRFLVRRAEPLALFARLCAGSAQPSARFSRRGIALRLLLTCWLIYALHFATNTVREIYPALSLGDHLSFDVSEYVGLHPDIFELPGRGAYINNNPGASILGAIPYALTRPAIDAVVQRVQSARAQSNQPPAYDSIYPLAREFFRKAYERGLDVKFGLGAGVMQALLMAPLGALSAVVMFYILQSVTGSTDKALWLALLYAFATPIFYRSAQLNQNVLISHSALFAFALLWRPWDEPAQPRRPNYMCAGLLCGWALVLDYSGSVVILVLAGYAAARRAALPASAKSRTDLLEFGAGVLACVALLLWYQWLAFGSPFFPAQRYMPPTPYSRFGYSGMDFPQLDLLGETAFGIRFGLFLAAPILLLALYFPAWLERKTRLVGDRELWTIVIFTLAFFLFAAANQYGRLQFNSGVRYVVPVTPFLFLLAASVLLRMSKWLAVAIGSAATYWAWCLAQYRDVELGWGVFEALIHVSTEGVRLPWLMTLERMGYVSAMPLSFALLCVSVVVIWVMWRVKVH